MRYFEIVNDEKIIKINKKTKKLYFHIMENFDKLVSRNEYRIKVRRDPQNNIKGISIALEYVLSLEEYFHEIYELEKLYPSNNRSKLRFMHNRDSWPLHRDLQNARSEAQRALILPLINCNEGTITSWYNYKSGVCIKLPFAEYIDLNKPYEVEKVCSTSFLDNHPVIINTDEWHDAINNTGKERVMAGWYCNG